MPEPVTKQQSPFDFVLEEFLIHSNRHEKPIDVTNSISIFQIFENINKPYLEGSFILRDDMRFYDGVKPNGTELCEVTITQPSMDAVPVKLFFVLQIVKGTKKVGDQVEMIDVRMIEQSAYNSAINKFSKSYSGTCEEIIQNICRDHLKIEVDLPTNPTAQAPMKVCVPFMSPFEACNWILSRMSTTEGLPYFLFKTIKDKNLQLKSFNEMYDTPTWNKLPYTFSKAHATTPKAGTISSEQIFNVEKFSASSQDGIFDLITTGTIGSSHSVTDMGSGQTISFNHNLKDTYSQLTEIGLITPEQEPKVLTGAYELDGVPIEQLSSVNVHRLISNNTYSDIGNFYQEFDEATLKLDMTRAVLKQLLVKSSINIQVPGLPFLIDESNRTLGRNIDFTYISNKTHNAESGDDMFDKNRSGKYMIYATRHIFDENGKHKTNMRAVKLGIMK